MGNNWALLGTWLNGASPHALSSTSYGNPVFQLLNSVVIEFFFRGIKVVVLLEFCKHLIPKLTRSCGEVQRFARLYGFRGTAELECGFAGIITYCFHCKQAWIVKMDEYIG